VKSSNEDKQDKQPGQALANCQPVACPTPIPQSCRPNCGSLGAGTEGGQDPQSARLEARQSNFS
jgi:hypothetical protein